MESIARRLLSSQGRLHFRKLTFTWFHEEDPLLTTVFVEECPCTLESLDVTCDSRRTSIQYLRPHL